MTVQEQIESFYQFATEQLSNGVGEKSVDELFGEWRMANPTPEEYAENVAAIQSAIDEMNDGDKGHDVREVIQEIRDELNLPRLP